MSGQDTPNQIDREFRSLLWIMAALIFGLMFLGCSNDDLPVAVESKQSPQTPVQPVSHRSVGQTGIAPAELLVGTWLGGAYIDEARVDEVLNQVNEPTRELLKQEVDSFLAMVMAIDFRRDGSVDNEFEFISEGRTVRVPTTGVWKVLDVDDDLIVVEMTETLPDGTIETSNKSYKLYEDGDHFAISVPLSDALANCNPLLVFERQQLGPTAIAENVEQTQKK